jgi:hypothetical protein
MVLELSLPTGKVVWALAHPVSREYIHDQSGIGYQEHQLIITMASQLVKIELDDFPKWAQAQIVTSIHTGELINTGESHIRKPKETREAKSDIVITSKVEKPKTTKKKATKRSNAKSKNE